MCNGKTVILKWKGAGMDRAYDAPAKDVQRER